MDNLSSFYYTQAFVGNFISDPSGMDAKRNCAEWAKQTDGNVSVKDIYMVQYEASPDDFLYGYNYNQWGSLRHNTFITWLLKKSNKEALRYMALSKQIEYYQFSNTDPWNTETDNNKMTVAYDSLLQGIAAYCKKPSLSAFLKQRYAFQAVKLAFYIAPLRPEKYQTYCDTLFYYYDKYLNNKKTIVADWGLLYYGLRKPNGRESTSALVKAFDRSEEKKGYVHNFLNFKNLTILEKQERDPEILSIIASIKGLKNPGRALSEIKRVYTFDRHSKYLPILIAREVNKLEDWILSPQVLGFQSETKENIFRYRGSTPDDPNYVEKNLAKDKLYLLEFRDYCITLFKQGFYNQDFLKLTIVHLYHMEHDFTAAKPYLESIHNFHDSNYFAQKEIEATIALIYTADIENAKVQKKLLKHLQNIGTFTPRMEAHADGNTVPGKSKSLAELCLLLSERYQQLGDIVKASLLFQKANITVNDYYGSPSDSAEANYSKISFLDKYGSVEDVDNLLAFKHKKNKSRFEAFITPKYLAADDLYLDLKGTILLREKKYNEALAVFEKMDNNFWKNNYEYSSYLPKTYIGSVGALIPEEKSEKKQSVAYNNNIMRDIAALINTTHIVQKNTFMPGERSEKPYAIVSKKNIMRDIVALVNATHTVQKDADKALAYYQLGCVLYNITYDGKAWMMYSYGKSSDEEPYKHYNNENYSWAWYSFYPNSVTYGKEYYYHSDAIAMFQKALAYSKSEPDLAAKVLLMLSVCSSKQLKAKYLNTLKSKYSKTATYALAITNCPDISGEISRVDVN